MNSPKQNKNLLGRGIRSLLQSIDDDLKTSSGQLKNNVVENVTGISRINIKDIIPNPNQPRYDFDEQQLIDLATSISQHDIIQPVTVTKIASGKYQLISGERRWRAAQRAKLNDIPAYIRQANDAQLLELALIENLQRENLNAIEISLAYKRMMEELNYSQDQLAVRMGKDRSTIANFIRLLKLPPSIQLAVRKGILSMGHARALINVDVIDKQLFIFNEIQKKDLSVRQTEALVRTLYRNHAVKSNLKKVLPEVYKKIEDKLASHFSTRVKLKHQRSGGGSVTIEYYSVEELNSLLAKMAVITS